MKLRLFAIVAVVSLLSVPAPVVGQTPEQVVKAWADKRAGIQNARFELDVECFQAKETDKMTKQVIREHDVTYRQHVTLILDFEKGRFRKSQRGEEYSGRTKKNEPYDGSTAYDGKTYFSMARPPGGGTGVGLHTGRASDYMEVTGHLARKEFDNYLLPAFFVCGVVPLEPDSKLYPGQFHTYDSTQFADVMFPSRRRTNEAGGRWFETVQSVYRDRTELLVTTDADATVLARVKTRRDGSPMYETTIKYAKKDGRRVPESWQFTNTYDGGLLRYRCTVEQVVFNAPLTDDLFTLTPDEGMVAAKIKYPEQGEPQDTIPPRETYEVKAGGKMVRNDDADPYSKHVSSTAPVNRTWYWIAGAGAVVAGASVGVVLFRRRSRKAQ